MMKRIFLLTALSGLFFLSACSTEEGTTSLVVRLTDSPGDYEKVNIDLLSVEVHLDSEVDSIETGWITLDSNPGIYDLLELTGGVSTVIAEDELPAGRISQMRLILGDNNSVVVDGQEFALKVPSGSQSGLKIKVQADLIAGIPYSLLIDFDAAKSVVSRGSSGKYNLKPVIRAVTEAEGGAIKGVILPASESVAVYALQGEDTIRSSYAIENNSDYFLGGLPTGTFTISYDPGTLSDYAGEIIDNVNVTVGEVTMLSEVTLNLK